MYFSTPEVVEWELTTVVVQAVAPPVFKGYVKVTYKATRQGDDCPPFDVRTLRLEMRKSREYFFHFLSFSQLYYPVPGCLSWESPDERPQEQRYPPYQVSSLFFVNLS